MPCSGDHSQYQAAVEVAEAKAADATSQAELAHRAALGAMEEASHREAYISGVKDKAMQARLAAYAATLVKRAEQAMDRKHDEEKKEKPSAEVAALQAQFTELKVENDRLAVAAVTPLANALAARTPNPAATIEGFGRLDITPAQIKGLYELGLGGRQEAPAVAGIYTAASLVPEAVQAPAPPGMVMVPQGAAPGAPQGQVSQGQFQSSPAIAATIPGMGAANSGLHTAGLVNNEFEVEVNP